MLSAIIALGGLGLVVGVGLAVASKVFYVYVDPKILAVEDVLPGANCGGCGFPGCSANAEAIVEGKSPPTSCVAGGPELAEQIAALLGVSVEAVEPDFARPGCYYGTADAALKYTYLGVQDCRAAALLSGGMKVCGIGCLGLGTCVRACPFDALSMGPDHLPVVDEKKCTGCGTCERICPKNIIRLSSVTRRIMREYTTEDCTTPCQRACPAGINIREYVRQIAKGEYAEAVKIIKERNPLPAVIGRICPHPCETECRRNLLDESVAINYLKRFAADYEMRSGSRILPYKAPATGRRVAIAGGGVQGICAGFFVARLGHAPTVLEGASRLGGLLRTAIPETRLSQEVLDWEIEGVLAMGVEARTDQSMGKDFTVDSLLRDGYEAVFTATGGWDSRLGRGAGSVAEEVVPGTLLLIDAVRPSGAGRIAEAGHAVFFGGGKKVLDFASTCGAGTVTVLFQAGPDELGIDAACRKQAEAAGVHLLFSQAVIRLAGEDNRLTQIDSVDRDSGEKRTLPCHILILASGRVPELIFRKVPCGEEEGQPEKTSAAAQGPILWEALSPYKKPVVRGSIGLLSEGDAVTDFSAVVEAMGAARRAAASIHLMLNGLEPVLSDKVLYPGTVVQDVDHVEQVAPKPRQVMPLKKGEDVSGAPEVERGYGEAQARKEADRCLQCGLVCYLHTAGESRAA